MKWALVAAVLLVIGFVVVDNIGLAPRAPVPAAAKITDFSYQTLDGTTRRLADDRGRVVFLHFWATWCAPCIEEIPHLAAFAVNHPDVVIITISNDLRAEMIDRFIKQLPGPDQNNWAAKNMYHVLDQDRSITRDLYRINMFPETVVIDASGRFLMRYPGVVDWDQMGADGLLKTKDTP